MDALTEQPPPDRMRALLAEAWERKSDVLVPALVCAECCRGAGRPVLSNQRWLGIAKPVPHGPRFASSRRASISLAA